jgi:nucleotidyltransferase/DNA polymerase involved in DNA repair
MNLEVSLERDQRGILHAYVLERYEDAEGSGEQIAKGEDLLKHRYVRDVESAVAECNRRLRQKCRMVKPPTIVYITPSQERP